PRHPHGGRAFHVDRNLKHVAMADESVASVARRRSPRHPHGGRAFHVDRNLKHVAMADESVASVARRR
ncbi:hypothetical protein C7E18_24575, partial [Stenotrophomonas maltophilia]